MKTKVVFGSLNGSRGISKEKAESQFGTAEAEGFVEARIQKTIQNGHNISFTTDTITCAMTEEFYKWARKKIEKQSMGFLEDLEHGEAYVLGEKSGLLFTTKQPEKIS